MASSTDEIAAMEVSQEGAESQPPVKKKSNRPGMRERSMKKKYREQYGASKQSGPQQPRARADAWALIGNAPDAASGGAATAIYRYLFYIYIADLCVAFDLCICYYCCCCL